MINNVDLLLSLDMMWKGMLGLFVACGFMMGVIMVLRKICK